MSATASTIDAKLGSSALFKGCQSNGALIKAKMLQTVKMHH